MRDDDVAVLRRRDAARDRGGGEGGSVIGAHRIAGDGFAEVADALAEYELFVITAPGEATPLAEVGATPETHQTWVREPGTGKWRLDVFREPSEGDTWICRRDERIRLPYDHVIERTPEGTPYGRPEIVLLYKARHAELPKNEDDFAAVLPRLDGARRRWLAEALAGFET